MDTLLSRKQVAEVLGVSQRTVDRLRQNPSFPTPMMVGKAMRWSLLALDCWVRGKAPTKAMEVQP